MRAFLGDQLIYEADPTFLFDKQSDLESFEVVTALATGTVTATLGASGAVVEGYTPSLAATFKANGLLTAYTSDTQTQIFGRWQDNNNWISYTPNNGTQGRLRIRNNGTSTDTPVILTTPINSVQVMAEDTTLAFYVDGRLKYSWRGSQFAGSTKKGVGNAGASATLKLRALKFEALREWNRKTLSGATTAEVNESAASATTFHRLPLLIQATPTARFLAATADGDLEALEAMQACSDALQYYPKYFLGTTLPTLKMLVGTSLSSGSAASGLYINETVMVAKVPTQAQFDSVVTDLNDAREHVIHHVLMHAIESHGTSILPDVRAALSSAFVSSNPPGFTYGATTEIGGRPLGFCRGYGRTSFQEDVADVFGWMMTDGLKAELSTRVLSDSHLAGKVTAVQAFLRAMGWPERYIPAV